MAAEIVLQIKKIADLSLPKKFCGSRRDQISRGAKAMLRARRRDKWRRTRCRVERTGTRQQRRRKQRALCARRVAWNAKCVPINRIADSPRWRELPGCCYIANHRDPPRARCAREQILAQIERHYQSIEQFQKCRNIAAGAAVRKQSA